MSEKKKENVMISVSKWFNKKLKQEKIETGEPKGVIFEKEVCKNRGWEAPKDEA